MHSSDDSTDDFVDINDTPSVTPTSLPKPPTLRGGSCSASFPRPASWIWHVGNEVVGHGVIKWRCTLSPGDAKKYSIGSSCHKLQVQVSDYRGPFLVCPEAKLDTHRLEHDPTPLHSQRWGTKGQSNGFGSEIVIPAVNQRTLSKGVAGIPNLRRIGWNLTDCFTKGSPRRRTNTFFFAIGLRWLIDSCDTRSNVSRSTFTLVRHLAVHALESRTNRSFQRMINGWTVISSQEDKIHPLR